MRSVLWVWIACLLACGNALAADFTLHSKPHKSALTGSEVMGFEDADDGYKVKYFTPFDVKSYVGSGGGTPSWLPSTGPTATNQIIQATGAGASAWTSIIAGLINDAGTGTDDLWSADKIISTISAGRRITVSTSDPSGGQNGDVWFKVAP